MNTFILAAIVAAVAVHAYPCVDEIVCLPGADGICQPGYADLCGYREELSSVYDDDLLVSTVHIFMCDTSVVHASSGVVAPGIEGARKHIFVSTTDVSGKSDTLLRYPSWSYDDGKGAYVIYSGHDAVERGFARLYNEKCVSATDMVMIVGELIGATIDGTVGAVPFGWAKSPEFAEIIVHTGGAQSLSEGFVIDAHQKLRNVAQS